jgi:cytoskeletal protein CcmA (bactofilin family)
MTALTFAAMVAFAIGWVLLPLIPALRELYAPSDVEPLSMVGRDNADLGRFARHFRDYIRASLEGIPAEARGTGDFLGTLPDGTAVACVAGNREEFLVSQLPAGLQERVVVLEESAQLEGGERFSYELWARKEFAGGPSATYRAILGERSVGLARGSVVLRWLHGVGAVTVEDQSHLYGRCSSETQIRLGKLVGFDRISAPAITTPGATARPRPPAAEGMLRFERPERAREMGDTLRVEQDWSIPPGVLVDTSLVVAGELRIGKGARIRGNVKAHGEIHVGMGAVVEGSLVSRKAIAIGEQCWVDGPVLSEEHLRIAAGTNVGSADTPTTVAGRTVSLGSGAMVCGQIVTEEGGQTED